MTIKYKDYRLVPDGDRFNLIELKIGTKKDSEETFEKEDNLGFGFTKEGGIRKIALLELAKDAVEVNGSEFNTKYLAKVEEIENYK